MSISSLRRLAKSPAAGGLVLPIALALAVSACASKKKASLGSHTDATGASYGGKDYSAAEVSAAVEKWGKRYSSDPDDPEIALNYATVLRMNGQLDQAVAVLRKATIKHQKDRQIAAAYGKALAAKGRFGEAMKVIRAAHSPDQPDWRLLSAEGAILDQTGAHDEARTRYAQALKIRPNEPSVLNNEGLSYVLSGDLTKAEAVLRRAVAQPGSDSRVRQNLALVLGLSGKFDEAEKIARDELDPRQAEANIAYLRGMLSQRNSWQKVKEADARRTSG
ncbi:tetratricopeptide repeat protein [Rhodobium gokarnense]|uniref:Flp pilus assembly protein TadD n=1 Tax=Rhodobium gokarnense TaxID=364296 RepID=A0ABT3H7Z8_9HYPH|nr:tetratricopeptide repeat protein [Rhodobium gokarnense]MCW2306522.1 Flp pilus assembly protein TadD [Rhodobium gokarnense]